MGYPMCTHVRAKIPSSSPLYIYDLAQPILEKFVAKNKHHGEIIIAKSPRDVAEHADIIITILPEGKHVKSVYFTPETGILAAQNRKDLIFVDSSTIDPESSTEVLQGVQKSGLGEFVDAPVSGGTYGAEDATLTFMVGCSESNPLWPVLEPILKMMGKNIFQCGAPTFGLVAKITNNYLSGINAIATSEAMNIGIRLGMDPKILQKVIAVSSGRNGVNEIINPVPGIHPNAPTSKNYRGGFKISLMRKDMGLANQAAKQAEAKMVLGDLAYQIYCDAEKDPNCFDRDNRVVYRYIGGKEDAIPGYPKPDIVEE
jgi:3-hydroxyisobutyrate dehydrogenase